MRRWLWKGGFMLKVKMKNDRPPSLLSQESSALSSFVHIVFHLHDEMPAGQEGADHSAARRDVAEPHLVRVCTEVLKKFARIDRALSEAKRSGGRVGLEETREVQMFQPIVVNILTALESAPAPFFRKHLTWLWPLLAELVCADSHGLREQLSRLMVACVTPALGV